MNLGDIIVLAAVLACVLLAVGIMRHNKNNGKRACGCQCADCSGSCGRGPAKR